MAPHSGYYPSEWSFLHSLAKKLGHCWRWRMCWEKRKYWCSLIFVYFLQACLVTVGLSWNIEGNTGILSGVSLLHASYIPGWVAAPSPRPLLGNRLWKMDGWIDWDTVKTGMLERFEWDNNWNVLLAFCEAVLSRGRFRRYSSVLITSTEPSGPSLPPALLRGKLPKCQPALPQTAWPTQAWERAQYSWC